MTKPVKGVSVERPRTEDELAAVLREAAGAGKAVVPVGGRRAGGMGDPLERCDLELHTGALDRVIEHSPADMVVTVEAGIALEAVQAELSKHGQFLPIDPFNSPGHTVGGVVASGWSGPLRLRFGTVRDFMIGIRVALPDGRIASAGGRVVKNVSGYDMMKLHIGALGSLGVIVAASFKVFPRPLHDVTLTTSRQSIGEAWTEVERALGLAMGPSALELFSDGRVAGRFFGTPSAVRRTVSDLDWDESGEPVWEEHSRAAFERWARIAVPPSRLRAVLDSLPGGSTWWASPGVGLAQWSFPDARAVMAVRSSVEAIGGSLVLMAAPDGVKRQAGAWGTPPATLEVMRRLKDAFDPGHVLNPGRFVV